MTYRRILYILLALGLLASLHVSERRERQERAAATVEIVMDDADFGTFARSFGIDQERFLKELKAVGLTSLGVSEELGAAVPGSGHADAYTGGALRDASVLAPLHDPLLAQLVRTGAVDDDAMYILAYDAPTARRYARQLPIHFPPATVRRLRATLPALWEVRTQSDYFAAAALGLPDDRLALARRVGLYLVPRLQNDQNFSAQQIAALVDSSVDGPDATTAIFFGLRSEVLGYPDQLPATAQALREHQLLFGTIEVYDAKTLQLGNDALARRMAARVVRVQAISKVEQDKLKAEEVIARFLLGVRERNVRVVYLRPFTHPWRGRSVEATNVAIVAQIVQGIRASGYRIGRPVGITRMGFASWEMALVSLAVPAILLLVASALGYESRRWLVGLTLVDVVVVEGAFLAHHDLLVRQLVGLGAGLAFPTAGLLAIAWAFRGDAPPLPWLARLNPYGRGLVALVTATALTLAGALVVTGMLSTPATMTEIDRFAGVKELLVIPALLGVALYFFSAPFGAKVDRATAGEAPVRWLELIVAVVLLGGAFVVLERSGNQTDISPSGFELSVRSQLTDLLQVRPRFKEFMVGFPALMLLPALIASDRRRWGWLFMLAIGMGLADVIDTFSHFHTPLLIGAFRTLNGAVIGAAIGAVAIAAYRFARAR